MKRSFEPVLVDITSLHPRGYGVSEAKKINVFGALPGERVTVLPFSKKRKKIFARVVEIHEMSPDRVSPPCDAADICGGCSLQHLDTRSQITYKHGRLVESLADNQPLKYFPPITGPVLNYRSKARLGVRYVEKKNRVLVGFREKMKPYIADITACPVLREPVSEMILPLAELVSRFSNPRCVPQIEVSAGDSETALVFRHLEDLSDSDKILLTRFAIRHSVSIYLQPGGVASVHKLYPVDDDERVTYELPEFNLSYAFHPLDFTQVNHVINRKMVHFAIELLELRPDDRVFDGFCGIGNFSLAMARKSASVIGIESSIESIERAKENAVRNDIKNCLFVCGDLFAEDLFTSDLFAERDGVSVLSEVNKVLIDPPRTGALEVCKWLATNKVERVVYVSCNQATLARDAEILVANGYQFEGAGIIDMFPHTNHVESIACFSYYP